LAEGYPRATPATKLLPRHALLLGIVQGPTEVLPVSSSAHIVLLPRLAGWPHAEQAAELRNSLEVALHAGTAAALVLVLRGELGQALRELDGSTLVSAALALAPPAFLGYFMEQRLERRPSGTRALAAGLTLGAAAMAWADTRPQARSLTDFTARDGLALGLAQALALLPGVSRNGATLAAARTRGFAREDAQALSWRVGLPVIAGAAALKVSRLGRSRETLAFCADRLGGASVSLVGPRFAQRRSLPGAAPALAAGTGAAFLSTLACAPLLRPGRRGRALWPFALYRAGLALAAVASSGSA
jgi:undecaprenyl-diphosphatase